MFNLIEASRFIQAFFLAVLFLTVTVDFCCLPNLFLRKYRILTRLTAIAFGAFGFCLLVVLSTGMYSVNNSIAVPYSANVLLENAEYSLLFVVCNLAFLAYLCIREIRYRKNNVSTLSIKESFDHLPTGLCFSKANGTVQLVNHKMDELGYILTGEEIQNANTFWKALLKGEVLPGVQRVSDEAQPEYRLPDGTVYTFKRVRVENVFQITATDTTSLHKLANRLRTNNEELEEMNERLRCYGETVDETTRARERLETKIRIHSELGQALLATRHAISQPNADYRPIINTWKRNIAVLRTQTEPAQSTDLLNSLLYIAKTSGIEVEIIGEFPEKETISELITSAATEALTNAVRHADAKTLRIELTETENYCCARYTNDGTPPTEEIREGGGLGSLRSKIERFGGNMEIQSLPQFEMTVTLPKEVNLF